MKSLLIVDSFIEHARTLQAGLSGHFTLIEIASNAVEASALLQRCHFDLLLLDWQLPDQSALEWLAALRQQGKVVPIMMMVTPTDWQAASGALHCGIIDLLSKPVNSADAIEAIKRYWARLPATDVGSTALPEQETLLGECHAMQTLRDLLARIAPMPVTVLLEGESGTGKELAAREIHAKSGRRGAFVAINCAAMSAELVESSLFGHARGAFTGAYQAHDGLFLHANKGTILLDEIGDMPLALQVHLLRVLEEKKIRPVGANMEVAIDVRVIAASNRELAHEVKQKRFREDLYYRLQVLKVRIPPLRERPDDITVLASYFQQQLAATFNLTPPVLAQDELERLAQYAWPGNVRELKNVLAQALLLERLPSACLSTNTWQAALIPESETLPSLWRLDAVEKQHMLRVLQICGNNKSKAARKLGISRKTLERRVRDWEQ